MYKKPAEIEKKLGEEVFVVANDGDVEVGDVDVFDDIDDLKEHLSQLNPVAEANTTVIHGVITSAEYIPEDIGMGAYILAMDPGDIDTGAIFEFSDDDPDKLAEMIEELISDSENSIYSAANELEGLSIENIFIIYGYELSLGYAVNEDDVDDQIIEDCRKIADVAKKMLEKGADSEG